MSTLTLDKTSTRRVPDRLSTPAGRILSSREALLFAITVAIFIANSSASPRFLDLWNLAALVMRLVTFGLRLLIVPGIVMQIFIGLLLILVIALPIVIRHIRSRAAA